MLRICRTLSDIRFAMLMDVYEEGNRENAAIHYPSMDRNAALLCQEQDFYAYLSQCFFTVSGAFYAVMEVQGRYVCALRMEPYQGGYLLEALETRPDQRKKGYAKELIRLVLQRMDSPVYSHIHKENIASRKTHLSCGFAKIWDRAMYIDGSIVDHSETFCFTPDSEKVVDK